MAEVPIGTIVPYAGILPGADNDHLMQVAPGWLLCNGAALSSEKFKDLWNAIKNSHGNGKGSPSSAPDTDFNLPDYRGLFLRGVSGPRKDSYADPDREKREPPRDNGTGNSKNSVGSIQSDELKTHDHSIDDPGHSHEVRCTDNDNQGAIGSANPDGDTRTFHTESGPTNIKINSKGGNETRPKNTYVHYIIRAK